MQKSTNQMRILQFFDHLDIIKLDIKKLVNGFEGSSNGDIVLQFDGNLMIHQGLEETVFRFQ